MYSFLNMLITADQQDNQNIIDILSLLSKNIDDHKNDKEPIEIEGRLGYWNDADKYFDTMIDKKFFDLIHKKLEDSEVWDNIMYLKETIYYHKSLRLSVNEKNKKKCIEKIKLEKKDLECEYCPFDIRFCISSEKSVPLSKFPKKLENLKKRTKDRTSYIYNDWSFDLTHLIEIENTVQEDIYQIEIEYLGKIKNIENSPYVCHSLLLKLQDLINMIEPLGDNRELRLI